jgi:hypothetical protein
LIQRAIHAETISSSNLDSQSWIIDLGFSEAILSNFLLSIPPLALEFDTSNAVYGFTKLRILGRFVARSSSLLLSLEQRNSPHPLLI